MAIFYLDASANAKLYFQNELGVDFMLELLVSPSAEDIFFTSTLSIVEVKAAISRRINEIDDRASLLAAHDRDVYQLFELLPVSLGIITRAGEVAENYRLRAGDAIHLASALSVAATVDTSQVFMVSSDAELLDASEEAGIGALDPQADGAADSLRQFRA